MHAGSVVEPEVKASGQDFSILGCFPCVSHKELKCLGKEETEQVCKCLDFAS